MGLLQLGKHLSPAGNHPYTRPLFDEDGPTSRVNFYVESPPSCGYRGLNVDVESLMLLSNVTARIRLGIVLFTLNRRLGAVGHTALRQHPFPPDAS